MKQMDADKIAAQLKSKYPEANLFIDNSDGFAEVLAEVEPAADHETHSVAIAVAGKSRPHYHNKLTETYEVIKGTLVVFVDGAKHVLTESESITIAPGSQHWVDCDEAWFRVSSSPGWTIEDHKIIS